MQLKIIGSSSAGNSMILEGDKESLLLECGVSIQRIKKALNFNVSNVVGCLISHCHGDHSKSTKEVMKLGIDVYSSKGTFEALKVSGHRVKALAAHKKYSMGEFQVMPFEVKHDAPEPFGFLIKHGEDLILFVTDSYYIPYTFPGLTNIIVEANYSQDILDENIEHGHIHPVVRGRVLQSHMDLNTLKEALKVNDLSKVNNIVLIHLSDGNSNAKRFQEEIIELTGKNVHVADSGMVIDMSKNPF